MIEYGLSVSLNGSPRTPRTPRTPSPPRTPRCPRSSSFTPPTNTNEYCGSGCGSGGAPRKIMKFADICSGNDDGSISPRALFPPLVTADNIRRRLDFSFSDLMVEDEISPVPFTAATTRTASLSVAGGGCGWTGRSTVPRDMVFDVCDDDCGCSSCSVGECGVCYANLPLRANHIFTLCGHLFCVRCLLKWWDTSSTCPICRAELFVAAEAAEAEADDEATEDGDNEATEDGDDDEATTTTTEHAGLEDTLINRYLLQDRFFERQGGSFYSDSDSDSDSDSGGLGGLGDFGDEYDRDIRANIDDAIHSQDYSLSYFEIQDIRINRQIAMNLYARMVFREMLLSQNVEFRGDVQYSDSVIPKLDWSRLVTMVQQPDFNTIMYEFVIRRGSDITPLNEVNLFGFIKEIRIISGGGDNDDDGDYDWENLHEYAFIADVFSSRSFVRRHGPNGRTRAEFIEYGSYDMTEGTISPTELVIPFSQIRRLYRMRSGCVGARD